MKTLYAFVIFLGLSVVFFSTELQANQIHWMSNYNQALQASKDTSKPIFLLFTGTDWCVWCQKLEGEVLESQEFMQALGDRFIFVKLDYPRNNHQDPAIIQQNERLKGKYQIRGYPTMLIIDGNERIIASPSYVSGGGGRFAADLLNTLNR